MFDTKRLSQIGLLTGIGAVLPAVGTAEAAPVCTVFPCAFTVTSSPAEVIDPGVNQNSDAEHTTVTFNQFDPSLGTLTEVDVSLTSTLFGFVTVSADTPVEDASAVAVGNTSWDASFSMTMPGVNYSDSRSDSVNCFNTGFSVSCSNSKDPSSLVTFSDSLTAQSILDQYNGLGTLDATFNLNLMLTVTNESSGDGNASGGGNATWDRPNDGLTVTYIFTPNSTVPEPGTLALLGMGAMAGLGFARRRVKPDG